MKIYSIIMFQFILGLFGCKNAPKQSTARALLGPFTIETSTKTGKTWNMKGELRLQARNSDLPVYQ